MGGGHGGDGHYGPPGGHDGGKGSKRKRSCSRHRMLILASIGRHDGYGRDGYDAGGHDRRPAHINTGP